MDLSAKKMEINETYHTSDTTSVFGGGGVGSIGGNLYISPTGKVEMKWHAYAVETHGGIETEIGDFTLKGEGEVGLGVAGGIGGEYSDTGFSIGGYTTTPIGVAGGGKVSIQKKKEKDEQKQTK